MSTERSEFLQTVDAYRAFELAGGPKASESKIVEFLRRIKTGWPPEREFMAGLRGWIGHPTDEH